MDFDEASSLFAVFDGHGGSEVALYCSQKLPDFIKSTEAYKLKDFNKALKDAFIGFDATLVEEEVIKELKKLIKEKSDGDTETEEDGEGDGEDEENLNELHQESRMPLNELLEKLKDGKNRLLRNVKLEAGGSKPMSPILRGRRNGESSSADSSECSARKLEVGGSEEEGTVSSSDAVQKGDSLASNEASSSASCSGSAASAAASASASAPASTSAAGSSSDANAEIVNGPSSSSSLKVDFSEKNHCNSPDSSSAAIKINDEKKEQSVSGSDESATATSHSNQAPVNGACAAASSSEVSASASSATKTEGVSSSSSSAAVGTSSTIGENGVVSSNDGDRSQRISSSKPMPSIGNDSSTDEDDEDGSYNEDRSSTESEGDDGEMDESDTEEEDDEMYPPEFDDDEKFLNGMHEGKSRNSIKFQEINTWGTQFTGPGSSSGCTAVVALLTGNDLYVANAGDSRCVVCRNGKAMDMSFDHKPEDTEELERIRKAGGRVTMDGRVNGGLNLSRAIGDHAYKTVRQRRFRLSVVRI